MKKGTGGLQARRPSCGPLIVVGTTAIEDSAATWAPASVSAVHWARTWCSRRIKAMPAQPLAVAKTARERGNRFAIVPGGRSRKGIKVASQRRIYHPRGPLGRGPARWMWTQGKFDGPVGVRGGRRGPRHTAPRCGGLQLRRSGSQAPAPPFNASVACPCCCKRPTGPSGSSRLRRSPKFF